VPLVTGLQAPGASSYGSWFGKKIPISPANTGGGKINDFFHAVYGFFSCFYLPPPIPGAGGAEIEHD